MASNKKPETLRIAKKRQIARRARRTHPAASRPPALISIAAEGANEYVALDATHRVWRGRSVTKADGSLVIMWRPVASDFSSRRQAISSVDEEDELEP